MDFIQWKKKQVVTKNSHRLSICTCAHSPDSFQILYMDNFY